MPRERPSFNIIAVLAALVFIAATGVEGVGAQIRSDCCEDPFSDLGVQRHHHDSPAKVASRSVGQDAIAAIQEVVGLLLADPNTDWSRVSINRLRQHLVDLDEVMLRAVAEEREIDRGLEIRVSGPAPTLEALARVVPVHVEAMGEFRGWKMDVEKLESAVQLTLVASGVGEQEVIRAMGFFGLMASGVHRPHQLLGVARGL